MAICCLSLIGIPLTVGFVGKLYLVRPALESGYVWLAIILVLNAAISAGYYLRVVGEMFLKEPPTDTLLQSSAQPVVDETGDACSPRCMRTIPLVLAGVLSAGACLCLGSIVPAISIVRMAAREAYDIQPPAPGLVTPLLPTLPPPKRVAPAQQ